MASESKTISWGDANWFEWFNKMVFSTGFPVSAAKSTSGKQGDLCRRGSKNTTGIYDSPVPRSPPFLNTPTRPATILSDEVKFIDRDPRWYTRRVKEAIHIRLHPNNINRDSGIEIPEAWMPAIKKHNNRRTVQQRTTEGTATRRNNGTIGGSKCTKSQPTFVI